MEKKMGSTKYGEITVFGKKNCGLCEAAKDKLRMLELPFNFVDIGPLAEHHEGWRNDGSIEALAANAIFDGHLPIIKMGKKLHTYPQAMRIIKEGDAKSQIKTTTAPTACPVGAGRELVTALIAS